MRHPQQDTAQIRTISESPRDYNTIIVAVALMAGLMLFTLLLASFFVGKPAPFYKHLDLDRKVVTRSSSQP